jgi:type II secretory pathway pseudopilin PulG
LVVIGIIGTLVALILPALGGARAATRQLHCLNNLRNLGTAMINYSTRSGGGFLPPFPLGSRHARNQKASRR